MVADITYIVHTHTHSVFPFPSLPPSLFLPLPANSGVLLNQPMQCWRILKVKRDGTSNTSSEKVTKPISQAIHVYIVVQLPDARGMQDYCGVQDYTEIVIPVVCDDTK